MAINPNYTFVCTECKSDQRLDPEKNFWVQDGLTPPCRYCGGVVVYVEAATQEELDTARTRALSQIDRQRGLFQGGPSEG